GHLPGEQLEDTNTTGPWDIYQENSFRTQTRQDLGTYVPGEQLEDTDTTGPWDIYQENSLKTQTRQDLGTFTRRTA
ncbi:hypothetical protein RRG08_046003, partial [Elysia crispata]